MKQQEQRWLGLAALGAILALGCRGGETSEGRVKQEVQQNTGADAKPAGDATPLAVEAQPARDAATTQAPDGARPSEAATSGGEPEASMSLPPEPDGSLGSGTLDAALTSGTLDAPADTKPPDAEPEFKSGGLFRVFDMSGPDGGGCITAPSLCEWAVSFEAVIVGEIIAVEAVTSPGVVSGGYLVDTCSAQVTPGVAVTLRVLRHLRGALDGAETVAVHFGAGFFFGADFAHVSPYPTLAVAEPGLQFRPSLADKGPPGPARVFQVGTALGVGVSYDRTGKYLSPFAAFGLYRGYTTAWLPFTVDQSGRAVATPPEFACGRIPGEVDGLRIEELSRRLAACAPASSAAPWSSGCTYAPDELLAISPEEANQLPYPCDNARTDLLQEIEARYAADCARPESAPSPREQDGGQGGGANTPESSGVAGAGEAVVIPVPGPETRPVVEPEAAPVIEPAVVPPPEPIPQPMCLDDPMCSSSDANGAQP